MNPSWQPKQTTDDREAALADTEGGAYSATSALYPMRPFMILLCYFYNMVCKLDAHKYVKIKYIYI